MSKKPIKAKIGQKPTRKLKLFYSGSTSGESLPEQALIDKPADIMLTFFEIITKRGDTKTRFFRHERKRRNVKAGS